MKSSVSVASGMRNDSISHQWTQMDNLSSTEQLALLAKVSDHPTVAWLFQVLDQERLQLEKQVLTSVPGSIADIAMIEQAKGEIRGLGRMAALVKEKVSELKQKIEDETNSPKSGPDNGFLGNGWD